MHTSHETVSTVVTLSLFDIAVSGFYFIAFINIH